MNSMKFRSTTSSLGALFLCALILASAPISAQTFYQGETNGSYYQFAVPDGWEPSGGLVIWNHGFNLAPPGPEPELGPLVDIQLQQGYAVAASSYSLNGWALFQTHDDLKYMMDAFYEEVGVPEHVWVTGGSLGGIVTAQAIELGGLGNVVGALPICGAMAGSQSWDGAVDLRLVYDAVCSDVPGAAIPGGANGLAFPPDPNFDETALFIALNQCFGSLSPAPRNRTDEQQERLDRVLAATGLPENFILTDMGFATFGLADLVYDPRKLGGGTAFDTRYVSYGYDLDDTIERVEPDPETRRRFFDYYTPTGRVGDVKIVSIHTDGDGLVIVEHQNSYEDVVPKENLTVGIVTEDFPTHCGFSEAEVVGAWESLRAWVATGEQPDAADLQGACQFVESVGAQGPCRIDPGYEVPPITTRIRQRVACEDGRKSLCLSDRFLVEANWEDFEGREGDAKAAPLNNRSGAFYFFDPENIEITVKVLDGRNKNGEFWVFYGSMTNVGFEMSITDTATGFTKYFENPLGYFGSDGDTSGF